MKYEQFEQLMNTYKNIETQLSELSDLGFNFYDGKYKISDDVYKLFEITILSHYNVYALDWVSWFIFENEFGTKGLTGFDNDDKKICDTIESLYEYIEKNHKMK